MWVFQWIIYLTMEGIKSHRVLQNDLDSRSSWESRWNIEFYPSKCQVVTVTTSRRPVNTLYYLHCQVLEAVTSARYLGWTSLVACRGTPVETVSLDRTLGFLKRNIKTKQSKVREVAYNILVHSQLEYAFPIWDQYTKGRTHQNENVQRRAALWTINDFDTKSNVTGMFDNLGWRTLEQNGLTLAYAFPTRLCTDLWQSQCQSTPSPTFACPVIVTQ